MLNVAIILLGLGALALFFAMRLTRRRAFTRTVHEWEQGLLYVDGRFSGALEPGSHRLLGVRDRLIVTLPRQPCVEHVVNVDITSADRLSYRLSAVATYTIADPRAAHEGGHREKLRLAISDALVRLGAGRSLEVLLAERADLGEALLAALAQPVCGCRIDAVSVSAVSLPPELRRFYAEIERARLEGHAALERARGEQAALRSLANSARMLKGNPELMNLRLLQALSVSGGKGGATLVLGREAFATGGAAPREDIST